MVRHKHVRVARISLALSVALLIGYSMRSQHGIAATGDTTAEQLIGSWSLVSRITTGSDGVVNDAGLSSAPSGILIYDRSGHVAAQLSRPGRTAAMLPAECQEAQKVKGTPDTAQTILGYDAYFGTYSVDAKDGIVTHHLDSALFPGDIGKSIVRHFKLAGDVLTISFNTTLRDGRPVTRTLVWKRMT